jgi:hypothetical protein
MNRFQIMVMLTVAAGTAIGCHPIPALHHDHEIRISLNRPAAKEVLFLSSLNQYAPVSMNKTFSGDWELYLPEDKAFDYFFRIDGSLYTPECRFQQTDDWGGRQCIYSPGIQEP